MVLVSLVAKGKPSFRREGHGRGGQAAPGASESFSDGWAPDFSSLSQYSRRALTPRTQLRMATSPKTPKRRTFWRYYCPCATGALRPQRLDIFQGSPAA